MAVQTVFQPVAGDAFCRWETQNVALQTILLPVAGDVFGTSSLESVILLTLLVLLIPVLIVQRLYLRVLKQADWVTDQPDE